MQEANHPIFSFTVNEERGRRQVLRLQEFFEGEDDQNSEPIDPG
jgi:hypothetical protein